jgi:hypothetical protein
MMKAKVYTNKPFTTDDPKGNIRHETEAIPADILQRAFLQFERRAQLCTDARDGNFEHLT